jgi:hypothetical protein
MLADAGFVEARVHGRTGYRTSGSTEGALISARKPAEPRRLADVARVEDR